MKVWTDEVGINVAWDKPKQSKVMRPVRFVRVVNASLAGAMFCLAVLDLATGHILAFVIALVGVLANLGAVTFQTWLIRKRTRELRPRPDYSLIASMERPIWGEAFEHAGATATATSTGYAAGGHVRPRCGCVNCGGSASEHVEVIPLVVAEHAKPVGYIPLPEPLSHHPNQHGPEGER